MKKSPTELRESIIDKIMTLVSSGSRIRPGIRKMLNKDPELNKKFKDIEKDLEDLGKRTRKLASKVEKKYKGTPLEKFFSV